MARNFQSIGLMVAAAEALAAEFDNMTTEELSVILLASGRYGETFDFEDHEQAVRDIAREVMVHDFNAAVETAQSILY